MLEQVREKFEYLGLPFVNHQGKMFMNPGDVERYHEKSKTSLDKFITEGKLNPVNGVLSFEVTDKCLKSELQIEATLDEWSIDAKYNAKYTD